jgi:thioredoxin-related protein
MKKIIFYFLFLLSTHSALAQADTSLLYIKYPDVPPFTITKLPDSTTFAKANLQKKKALMLMIFSPDCEHCQHEVKEIIAYINLFKNVQIVMVSNLDYHYIKTFYKEYNIAHYPNIILGRDTSFLLRTFFHIQFLPAIFLYNKKGKFVKAFDGSVPVQNIAAAL